MDATTAATPPEPPPSLWEDFLDVFYAPREVFARREARRWPLVLGVITLVMLFLFFASQSALSTVMEAEVARAMRGNPNVTPEQIRQAQEMSGIFGMIGFAVAFPLGVMLTGVALWAVGRLFDSTAPLAAGLLIAAFAQFPRLIQQALAVLQGLVMDPQSLDSIYSVTFSAARFLDADRVSPLVMTLAGRLDLFVLWSTVLLAIGLQVRGGVSAPRSYAAAALVWLLAMVPALLGALAGGG